MIAKLLLAAIPAGFIALALALAHVVTVLQAIEHALRLVAPR